MSFFNKLVDVVADQVGDLVTDKVISTIQPPVKEEVTEHVTEFKTSAVEAIPRTIESKIAGAQDSDNAIASLVSSLLAGKVGPLVQKILRFLQPGIDSIAQDLPDSITNTGIQYAKDFLGDILDRDGNGERSREVGDGQDDGFFGELKEKLQGFLQHLREQLHPVFEALKPKIWELVPGTVQQALRELLDGDSNEQPQQQEQQDGERSRGFASAVGDFLEGTVKSQAIEQSPKVVELVQEPVQDIINQIVDKLEDACNSAFSTKLLSAVQQFKLA